MAKFVTLQVTYLERKIDFLIDYRDRDLVSHPILVPYNGAGCKGVKNYIGTRVPSEFRDNGTKVIYIHRLIALRKGFSEKDKVSFANGNTLDLRRQNIILYLTRVAPIRKYRILKTEPTPYTPPTLWSNSFLNKPSD